MYHHFLNFMRAISHHCRLPSNVDTTYLVLQRKQRAVRFRRRGLSAARHKRGFGGVVQTEGSEKTYVMEKPTLEAVLQALHALYNPEPNRDRKEQANKWLSQLQTSVSIRRVK